MADIDFENSIILKTPIWPHSLHTIKKIGNIEHYLNSGVTIRPKEIRWFCRQISLNFPQKSFETYITKQNKIM